MNVEFCIQQLSLNSEVVRKMVSGIDAEQARWKPSTDSWSVLEVVNHLLDEERLDFRLRLRHLLSGSSEPWPPITPQQWVIERAYNQRELEPSLANFLAERKSSLEWLSDLQRVNWDIGYGHQPLEGLSAGDLLVSWAAHDLLHLRQLVELKWAYGQTKFLPYATRYAGDW